MSTTRPSEAPTLIVPRGRAGARPKAAPAAPVSAMPMLTKNRILQISKAYRPTLTVAMPWALLSASALSVRDRAELVLTRCANIWPGSHNYISMCSFGYGKDSEALLILPNTTPGDMYVAELAGSCDGGGALTCVTGAGRTDIDLPDSTFNHAVAILSTYTSSSLRISIKTPARGVMLSAVKVWKLD